MLLVTMAQGATHSLWERAVTLRGAALRFMRPSGWLLLAALFMIAVLALMRAAGRADRTGI